MPYAQADSSGCPPFVLRFFFCLVDFARQSECSDVAEVDVDLLRRGLAVLLLPLVNNYLADEGSQHLGRQLLHTYIFLDDIKELLHIGTLVSECADFFLQFRNRCFKLLLFLIVISR